MQFRIHTIMYIDLIVQFFIIKYQSLESIFRLKTNFLSLDLKLHNPIRSTDNSGFSQGKKGATNHYKEVEVEGLNQQ